MSRMRKGGVTDTPKKVLTEKKSKKPQSIWLGRLKKVFGNSFRLQRKVDLPVVSPITAFRRIVGEMVALLRREWRVFLGLGLLYAFLYRLFIEGIARIDFPGLQNMLQGSSSVSDKILQTSILTTAAFDTASTTTSTDNTFYASFLTLVFGLCIVWAARQTMAHRKVRIRDALYQGPGPILSAVVIVFIIFLQALPMTIGLFVYNAATSTGLVQGGVESMVIFIIAALSALLTCYWLSSSLIALMLVTLPGMYPLEALAAAKEMVAHRRWQVFLRMAIFAVVLAAIWLIVIVITVSNPITIVVASEVIGVLRGFTLVVGIVFLYKMYRTLVDGADI